QRPHPERGGPQFPKVGEQVRDTLAVVARWLLRLNGRDRRGRDLRRRVHRLGGRAVRPWQTGNPQGRGRQVDKGNRRSAAVQQLQERGCAVLRRQEVDGGLRGRISSVGVG